MATEELKAVIGGDASGLIRATKQAGTALTGMAQTGGVAGRRLSDALKSVVGGLGQLAKKAGIATAAISALGAAAVVSFAKFEREFAQVRTLINATPDDLKKLSGGLRKLSVAFGRDLTSTVNAAYQAISAGTEQTKVLEFLGTAFRLAAGGAAEVDSVTKLLSSTMNAFGKAAGSASDVADIMFATVEKGVTTIPELAEALGQVSPVAAAAKIKLADMAAAMATLTKSGLSTVEASTALSAIILEIVKPTGLAAVRLKQLGITAEEFKKVGLPEVMRRLARATGGALPNLTSLISNKRALKAAAILAGEGLDEFNEILKRTNSATGAANEAFKKTTETLDFKFRVAAEKAREAFRSLGEGLSPLAERILTGLGVALEDVDTKALALGRAITDTLLGAFDKAKATFDVVSTIVGSLATALGTVATAITGALTGALTSLSEAVKTTLAGAFNSARVAMTAFAAVLTQIPGMAANALASLLELTGRDKERGFAAGLRGLALGMNTIAKTQLDALSAVVGGVLAGVDEAIGATAQQVKAGATAIGAALVAGIGDPLAGLKEDFAGLGKAIEDNVAGKAEGVKKLAGEVKGVGDAIKEAKGEIDEWTEEMEEMFGTFQEGAKKSAIAAGWIGSALEEGVRQMEILSGGIHGPGFGAGGGGGGGGGGLAPKAAAQANRRRTGGASLLGIMSRHLGGPIQRSGPVDALEGEFMVRRQVAQPMRPLLEAINNMGRGSFAQNNTFNFGGASQSVRDQVRLILPEIRRQAQLGLASGGVF